MYLALVCCLSGVKSHQGQICTFCTSTKSVGRQDEGQNNEVKHLSLRTLNIRNLSLSPYPQLGTIRREISKWYLFSEQRLCLSPLSPPLPHICVVSPLTSARYGERGSSSESERYWLSPKIFQEMVAFSYREKFQSDNLCNMARG